jgi:PKD repeat protein
LNNFAASGIAQVYQLTSSNAITRLTDLSFSGNTAAFTAPPQSITLLVLPTGAANMPPVAKASATPTSGVAPLTVAFSSAGSSDSDGSIVSYSWDFGDDTATRSSASPAHTYQNAGSFTAVLTVTDNLGAKGTANASVTVSGNSLVAPTNLTGSAGRGSVTLQWTDASTYQTGFYIERAPSGSTSFVRVGTVAGNVKTFTNTVSKGTYLYRVQAYNGSSVSAYSNTVTVRVTH